MDETIATTEYGESFASIVKDNIIGVLFHPEKVTKMVLNF